MNNINRKLRLLLMVLPLAGCASNVPLEMTSSTNLSATKVVSVKAPVAMINETKSVSENKKTETVTNTNPVEAQPQSTTVVAPTVNPLDRPGDLKALAQPKNVVSRPVNIDPNVKLIAPPVGLPATNYAVPKVEEKEEYVPPVYTPAAKTTTCTKGKNGKKVCKTSVKSEAKGKKGSSSAKVTKQTSKNPVKASNKKAAPPAKKKAATNPKKK